MLASNRIAVFTNSGTDDAQHLLARSAEARRGSGAWVVGVLAEPGESANAACSAGFLRDIGSGRRFAMALAHPPINTRCRLDAEGVQAACSRLLDQIPGADIVLLSKFGKLEASRKGLWPAFTMAISAGKPVLTTVSEKHVDALKTVAPRVAWLEADAASLGRWRKASEL